MRDDVFFVLVFILLDNSITCWDDMCFWTIIGLELKHLDIWPVLFYIEKVLHKCASSSIDTLKIVSNQGNIFFIYF